MKMLCDKVYGKTIDRIKNLLRFLLSEPSTGRALKRLVAFLFDFEEIEHTTVLGLTLQVIHNRLEYWS